MRVTIKGQVTIPKHIRKAAGFEPGTEVEFAMGDDGIVRVLLAERDDDAAARKKQKDMRDWLDRVAGSVDYGMTTEELMELTRGE